VKVRKKLGIPSEVKAKLLLRSFFAKKSVFLVFTFFVAMNLTSGVLDQLKLRLWAKRTQVLLMRKDGLLAESCETLFRFLPHAKAPLAELLPFLRRESRALKLLRPEDTPLQLKQEALIVNDQARVCDIEIRKIEGFGEEMYLIGIEDCTVHYEGITKGNTSAQVIELRNQVAILRKERQEHLNHARVWERETAQRLRLGAVQLLGFPAAGLAQEALCKEASPQLRASVAYLQALMAHWANPETEEDAYFEPETVLKDILEHIRTLTQRKIAVEVRGQVPAELLGNPLAWRALCFALTAYAACAPLEQLVLLRQGDFIFFGTPEGKLQKGTTPEEFEGFIRWATAAVGRLAGGWSTPPRNEDTGWWVRFPLQHNTHDLRKKEQEKVQINVNAQTMLWLEPMLLAEGFTITQKADESALQISEDTASAVGLQVHSRTAKLLLPYPVNPAVLLKKIRKILAGKDEPREVPQETLDLSQIYDIVDNEEAMVLNMLRVLAKNLKRYPKELHELLEQGELKTLREVAHKFKSSTGYAGVPQFNANLTAIERSVEDGLGLESLRQIVLRVHTQAQDLEAQVNQKIKELEERV